MRYWMHEGLRLHLKVIRATGLGTVLINIVVQRLLRVNGQVPHLVHFTSRIIGDQLRLHNDKPTLTSLASAGGLYIQALNGIELGRNILLAPGVRIISANHEKSGSRTAVEARPVVIGDDVWIGTNAIILPGVHIANRCVIGAGAVVTRSIEAPGSIVVGNPAQILRKM